MRANKSPGLADYSKRRLAAQNKITLWERELVAKLKADLRLAAAEKEIARLKTLVRDLQKTVELQTAKRELEKKKSPKVSESHPVAQRGKAVESTSSGSDGDKVWVEGYTRKDGTKVKGYWRRK